MDTFFIVFLIGLLAWDMSSNRRDLEKRLDAIQKDLAEIRNALTPTEWKS